MSIIEEGSPDSVITLTLDGELTIPYADELKTKLESTLQRGNNVSLDMKNVSEIDISGLQLLYAAQLSSEKTNKRFTIDNCSEAFKQVVLDAGYSHAKGCVLKCDNICI